MKLLRFLLIVVYMGYLVNAGLLFVVLPWSSVWGLMLASFPTTFSAVLDLPWLRGALSAFGALHLLLVVLELLDPSLLAPFERSQDAPRS